MSKQVDDVPLARRRALAAKLLLNGEGISEVSRKARLSLPTVSKYKDLVERGGADALARLRIHGGPSRLDDASQSWLVSAIKHSPGLHGYPGPTWTISQLRELISRRCGVQFSASHVGYLVRSYGLAYRLTYSTSEKASSATARKSQSDVYAARRKVAAKMLLDGDTVEYVSKALNISARTITKYRSMVIADGVEAVKQIKSSGRKATLGPEALEWLRGILERSPMAHGFETELWRIGDIQKLITEKFGVYHSGGHVRTVVGKLGMDHRMRSPKQRTEKKPSAMNDETLAWVAEALRQSPRAHGIEADHWTNARLRTVLHQRVGVDYSRGYIWEIAARAGVADLLTRRRG
ncbi:helix-turn-helix domain-containing protein [Paraburkholderia sp. RP-4-7]|uniref:Helix-turn-helix domain-containing protein n=1 Tax=Paraburkholderia polaris TaxID=2728848 RepID=A0A848IPW0_9BURK|nr:helix-turn-helix domain-containing protein [Paraburkholderia polaris]